MKELNKETQEVLEFLKEYNTDNITGLVVELDNRYAFLDGEKEVYVNYDELPFAIKKFVLKRNPYLYQYFKEQSLELSWIAIKSRPKTIKYVNKQYRELVDYVLEQNPLLLEFIRTSSQKQIEKALKKNGTCIQFIKNPTEKQILMALDSKEPSVIKHIPQTKMYCIYVITKNYRSLVYIKDKNEEYVFIAIRASKGEIIRHAYLHQHLTQEMIDFIFSQKKVNWELFQYVPDNFKTEELCLNVVSNKGQNLQFVPDKFKTPKVIEAAIKNDVLAIVYMHTDEIKNAIQMAKCC